MRFWNAISSILLTMSLTLPFAGAWLWMEYAQHDAKEKAEEIILEGIPLEDQVLLTFHQKDVDELLEWEHDREFEFAGQMYDVITKEQSGDSLSYWCLLDTRETAIKKQILALMQDIWQQDSRSQDRQRQLISFSKQLLYPQVPYWKNTPTVPLPPKKFSFQETIMHLHSPSPPVPPPQHT